MREELATALDRAAGSFLRPKSWIEVMEPRGVTSDTLARFVSGHGRARTHGEVMIEWRLPVAAIDHIPRLGVAHRDRPTRLQLRWRQSPPAEPARGLPN